MFDHFRSVLHICDSNYHDVARYKPYGLKGELRGVYFDAVADKSSPKGPGTTYFHELAHMIDHAATGFDDYLSNTSAFETAIVSDTNVLLKCYDKASDQRKHQIQLLLRKDLAHSCSDLIDAVSDGKLRGKYVHDRDYWRDENGDMIEGQLQAEAFAHFFEASMGNPEKLGLLQTFFPTAYQEFSNIIKSIMPDEIAQIPKGANDGPGSSS